MRLLLITFLFLSIKVFSQQSTYVVYFTDKSGSPYSISSPNVFLSQKSIDRRNNQGIAITTKDLPPNPGYVDSLTDYGATILHNSRWLNAALIQVGVSMVGAINSLGFVANSSEVVKKAPLGGNKKATNSITSTQITPNYGNSSTQNQMIGIDDMHADDAYGQGMTVAVMDEGFSNAHTLPVFDSLFMNNRVLGTYDFIANDTMVFEDGQHGTQVLSVLAGYIDGEIIGPAFGASYYLFRTENSASETPLEEFNWLAAAEYADSVGVDMIVSSLGYNEFDDPSYDYVYADMDGNTTVITQAADYAASVGILVVVSAGNEGTFAWQKILAPADGDSVLAVGAVSSAENYMSFSSQGPSSDGQIKPDVAAYGQNVRVANGNGTFSNLNGTSFACPAVAGLALGLWQQFPAMTNYDIMEAVRNSGSRWNNPDNLIGYGVPNYNDALIILDIVNPLDMGQVKVYPNPSSGKLQLNTPAAFSGVGYTVQVIDELGKTVKEFYLDNAETSVELDLMGLSAGVYVLHLYNEAYFYSRKIVIR